MNFLFAEVESISPADIPMFHEKNIGVLAIVFSFKKTVIEARINHEEDVTEVERMCDCVLVQKNLLFKFSKLF